MNQTLAKKSGKFSQECTYQTTVLWKWEINMVRSIVVFKKSTYRNWKKADLERVCVQFADLDKKIKL